MAIHYRSYCSGLLLAVILKMSGCILLCSAGIFPRTNQSGEIWLILTLTAVDFWHFRKHYLTLFHQLSCQVQRKGEIEIHHAFVCHNLCQLSSWMDKEAHLCLAWLILADLPSQLLLPVHSPGSVERTLANSRRREKGRERWRGWDRGRDGEREGECWQEEGGRGLEIWRESITRDRWR